MTPLVVKFTSIAEEDEISEQSSVLAGSVKNDLLDEEFIKILNDDADIEK